MKIAYILACVGLFGCNGVSTALFGSGGGSSSSSGEGGSGFVPPPPGTVTVDPPDAGGPDSGNDAGPDAPTCLSCPATDGCGMMDDDCGNVLDCGTCPSQVEGYPSACINNTCAPFNDTIFSPECVAVCGDMNMGAWVNCLTECQNQNCTVQQSCTNCNFLFSAEPDCLSCLHTNFPGQSCGG